MYPQGSTDQAACDANRASLATWAPLILRLLVGYGFMAHGYAKIARGPEHFAEILTALGIPAPHLMSWLTILIELVGGFAVLIGAYVPAAAAAMSVVLIVAAVTVHLPNGFSSIKLLAVTASGAYFGQPGYETDLLYLSCLVALVLTGTGRLSIQGWLAQHALMPQTLVSRSRGDSAGMKKLRIARPVIDLGRTAAMYCRGLGMQILSSFEDHDDFDGVMVGFTDSPYHLEFTRNRRHPLTPSPTHEDLLVIYYPSLEEWHAACERMHAAGFREVASPNPYWNVHGRTYEDADGYRTVLQQAEWSS